MSTQFFLSASVRQYVILSKYSELLLKNKCLCFQIYLRQLGEINISDRVKYGVWYRPPIDYLRDVNIHVYDLWYRKPQSKCDYINISVMFLSKFVKINAHNQHSEWNMYWPWNIFLENLYTWHRNITSFWKCKMRKQITAVISLWCCF